MQEQLRLLILHTYQHFSNRVWQAYDQAFHKHAVASNLTNWSNLNVQLFNLHAVGASTRGCGEFANQLPEPAGATTSCKNVETLSRKNNLSCFKSLLVTGL